MAFWCVSTLFDAVFADEWLGNEDPRAVPRIALGIAIVVLIVCNGLACAGVIARRIFPSLLSGPPKTYVDAAAQTGRPTFGEYTMGRDTLFGWVGTSPRRTVEMVGTAALPRAVPVEIDMKEGGVRTRSRGEWTEEAWYAWYMRDRASRMTEREREEAAEAEERRLRAMASGGTAMERLGLGGPWDGLGAKKDAAVAADDSFEAQMRAASENRGWEAAFAETDVAGRMAAHRSANVPAKYGAADVSYYGSASVKKALDARERGGRPQGTFEFTATDVEACLAGVSVGTMAQIDGVSDGRQGAFRVSASQYGDPLGD